MKYSVFESVHVVDAYVFFRANKFKKIGDFYVKKTEKKSNIRVVKRNEV